MKLLHVIDDDEALLRTASRIALRDGWETRTYGSADAFLNEIEDAPFGCILLDLVMPGMSGTTLIELLHERCPDWPVLVMTGFPAVPQAVHSFRNGALHFLQKPFSRAELAAALAEAAVVAERRLAARLRRQEAAGIRKLSKREGEVLNALAEGLQSKAIAWRLGISTRTVEMHRSNLLVKLEARNTSHAVGLLKLAEQASHELASIG